jgi:hypothetical protein
MPWDDDSPPESQPHNNTHKHPAAITLIGFNENMFPPCARAFMRTTQRRNAALGILSMKNDHHDSSSELQ